MIAARSDERRAPADERRAPAAFAPAGFFVLRTPLLPFAAFSSLGEGLAAPGAPPEGLEAALAADRAAVRARLRALVERADVREAIYVASPSLDESLDAWVSAPESERGARAERTLLRYLARMAGRATPFGLFSGCSLGRLGEASDLRLAEAAAAGRHTRLDMDYVCAVSELLAADPAIRAGLTHRPNSSLYAAAGVLRYAESKLVGQLRHYHLVAVEPSSYLEATLARARGGARPGELAAALVADDPEIAPEEAEAFVAELIDTQVLVPDLAPPVTGPEPVPELVAQLAAVPAGRAAAATLAEAQRAVDALDAGGPGRPSAAYRAIAETLAALPAKVDPTRLFQVDMRKSSPDATLGAAVVGEITDGIELLRRLAPPHQAPEELRRFRDAFVERYEAREVPLAEALDDETGVGYGGEGSPGAEASPLLEGLAFPGGEEERGGRVGPREAWLLRRLAQLDARGERELVLSPADVAALAGRGDPRRPPRALPESFAVMASVAAASPEALAAGDFRVHFAGASGPSGVNLLGRFCHGDPALTEAVLACIAAEEALVPDAICAEIVHLPQGRIGNILARPVLRTHEIVYLGRSGAPAPRQLGLDDLVVSVDGDLVVLRERRGGRRVLPRLTSAHNHSGALNLGLYRFLCQLQMQESSGAPGWDWGPLGARAHLPRVRHGRFVLAPAHWVVDKARLDALGKAAGAGLWRAVQALRAELGLPRFFVVADGDNELPVDLDDVLAIESFAHLVKGRTSAILKELWPGPDELVAHGPEGRYVHELVVPFVRRPAPAAAEARAPSVAASPAAPAAPARPPAPRRFPPGSEWLYAKIYTGTGTADRVLREAVAEVVPGALASGAADRWFFIRYGDQGWHLRVRFHGEPARLRGEVQPALEAALAPLVACGAVRRLAYDTYEREVERYGGDAGMALSEEVFAADSDAVLTIVGLLGGAGADARWRLTLRGMHELLGDLGFDLAGRLAVARRCRDAFAREHRVDGAFEKQLGDRFRKERAALEALCDPAGDAASPLAEALAAFPRRSARVRPLFADAPGGADTAALAPSYLHMHANRLLRSAARAQELVLYDFLTRIYESRLARERKGKAPAAAPATGGPR